MAKNSIKVIKSLKRLPRYFNHANSPFQKFKDYHSIDPLISYFAGLYTVQILIDLITTMDTITGNPLVCDEKDITTHLVTVLENERVKLKQNDKTKAIVESPTSSREYIVNFTNEIFETASALIETGQASGKTVTDLLTCAVLYEVGRGLFPFNETNETESEEDGSKEIAENEKASEDENDELKNEKIKGKEEEEPPADNFGSDDLSKSLSKMIESQEDVNLEDHISESIKNLTDGKQANSKEDEVIDNIIKKKLSRVDDDELEERINYCRSHAQRIVTAVKKGENPQLNSNSIVSKSITNDDIEKAIEFALEEPSEDEESGIAFPELPKTLPGGENQKEEPQSQTDNEETQEDEAEEQEVEDSDTAEYIAKYHKNTTHNKPVPKQLKKEDIKTFLEDGELLERATRCAKFAISAISYEDVDTALAELTKSMDLLTHFKERQD